MVAFYCEHLGCRIAHEFVNDAGFRYGVFLGVGHGTFLELFHTDESAPATNRFRHLAFEVDDVHERAAYFASLGHAPEVRRGRTDGALQFWITDPDGNELELCQYDEESVQHAFLAGLHG